MNICIPTFDDSNFDDLITDPKFIALNFIKLQRLYVILTPLQTVTLHNIFHSQEIKDFLGYIAAINWLTYYATFP